VADPEVSPIEIAIARYRAALLRRDQEAASRLVAAYGAIWQKLQEALKAIEAGIEAGKDDAWIRERIEALVRQVEEEVERYAIYADQEVAAIIQQMIPEGLDHTQKMVQLTLGGYGEAAIKAYWNTLPADAVQVMLGMTGDDSPLYQRMENQLGPAVAEQVRQALVEGVALGYNPKRIHQELRTKLGEGLTWSLSATRTAQLWAYREATRAGYLANGNLVTGWIWHSALDARVCLSCWAQHGSVHPLEEPLRDHWSGRCAMIPQTRSWADMGFEGIPETTTQIPPGEEIFKGLDPETQRQIMGPAMWQAWQDGKFDFRDLSVPYDDAVYGQMYVAASLKRLLGREAQRYYKVA